MTQHNKWRRGEYNIAINQQWRDSDDGLRSGYVRGPFGIESKRWTITHIPSGMIVSCKAETLSAAKAIVDQLLPLTDWTVEKPDTNGPRWDTIRKIVR